jgi:hypothetical protein
VKLTEEHLEIISRAAAVAAYDHLEKEKERREKEKHDRRLRNVKLLLRNYRAFVIHCSDIKLEINELNQKLDLDELDSDEFAIRSILKSKERTLAMLKYINKSLEIYRIICEKSGELEKTRRYKVVYDLYISKEKVTIDDLAERHSVNKRTIYKDIDKACETLTVLMFGVNGMKLW